MTQRWFVHHHARHTLLPQMMPHLFPGMRPPFPIMLGAPFPLPFPGTTSALSHHARRSLLPPIPRHNERPFPSCSALPSPAPFPPRTCVISFAGSPFLHCPALSRLLFPPCPTSLCIQPLFLFLYSCLLLLEYMNL